MLTDEQREFLKSHRLCVVGVTAVRGGPLLTPVYYVMDGDDVLISTTASRAKTKIIRKRPDVTLCVLHEEFPFPYLMVRGRGVIEEAGAPELMARIGEKMSGQTLPEAARVALEQRARDEGRIVLRFTPGDATSTVPRGRAPASRSKP